MRSVVELQDHIICVVSEEKMKKIACLINEDDKKDLLAKEMQDVEDKLHYTPDMYTFGCYGEACGKIVHELRQIWPCITWVDKDDNDEHSSYFCAKVHKDKTKQLTPLEFFERNYTGWSDVGYLVVHNDFKSELTCLINHDYNANIIILIKK